jgi:hypothetical protein
MATDNTRKAKDARGTHPYRNNQKIDTDARRLNFEANPWNQTTNTTQYTLNSIKFLPTEGEEYAIPHLKITEFQSSYLFNWERTINDVLNASTAFVQEGENALNAVKKLATTLKADRTTDEKQKSKVPLLFREVEQINRERILGRPIEMIKEMFQGRYIGTYEVPYAGDTYLKAHANSNWSNAESGGIAGSIKGILKKNTNVDYPITPTWNPDSPNDAPEIETELVLYNDSLTNLEKNFRFMHAFAGGAYWVQDNYRQLQPNIYDIHFPGYFQYYYCSLDLTVTSLGMKRRLTANGLDRIKSGGVSIPSDAMFPDAYKMHFTFKPLVPNNFNIYLKYLLEGSDSDVRVGNVQLFRSTRTPADIRNNGVINTIRGGVEAGLTATSRAVEAGQGRSQ